MLPDCVVTVTNADTAFLLFLYQDVKRGDVLLWASASAVPFVDAMSFFSFLGYATALLLIQGKDLPVVWQEGTGVFVGRVLMLLVWSVGGG